MKGMQKYSDTLQATAYHCALVHLHYQIKVGFITGHLNVINKSQVAHHTLI